MHLRARPRVVIVTPAPSWDVVEDPEGFSAEATVERQLTVAESDAFEEAVAGLPPLVRTDGRLEIRGMATVDEYCLWIYVLALGPGSFDDVARRSAADLLSDLWAAVHVAVADA